MGFLERRTEQTPRPDDRYAPKPGPYGGSNDPLYDAMPARRAPARPDQSGPVRRTDLTVLLGRTVLEARVQQVCREYGLIPRSGPDTGSGLSRSYLARAAGVELAADTHGVVTTVFLHFHGDDGFTSYSGEIPGGAGSVPRRAHLWAMLGRPDEQGEPYRDRFLGDYGPWDRWVLAGFVLHAQFAVDAENLDRVTLTLPERLPRAA
ncbi:hypothetical protein ACIBSW_09060 [Actinoplanes sp. NPDC049668]|uniref:hypothetical protein n=1 Tax=unclassified Actinoplanes TaxID=2626549 RepID=UPI0033A0DB0E